MLLLNVVAFLAIPFLAFAKIIMGPFQYSQGTFTVSWTAASDAPPSFDILLRKGAQRIPLVQEIPSSLGTYSYAIPSTTPPGDNYKVQFVVHDPSNPSPEILDTSPAFSVAQTDFSQTGSAASSATASVSSVSGSLATASASIVSGSSVTESLVSSLQSSVSTALASLTPSLSSGIVTTVTSGSVIYTTTINPVSATVSAISQSIASATSSAAAAASSSVTPSSAGALGFSWAGVLFSVAGAVIGAAVVF